MHLLFWLTIGPYPNFFKNCKSCNLGEGCFKCKFKVLEVMWIFNDKGKGGSL